MSRQRVAIVSYPIWTKEIEKWTLGQIRINKWRFDPTDDFEDLLQEARILFWKLERIYPTVISAAHFFTLYKTSFKRRMIDKARKQRRRVTDTTPLDDCTEASLPFSSDHNMGHLSVILDELPDELKTVLRLLTSERVRLKLGKSPRKYQVRENLNMRLKRRGILLENPTDSLKSYLVNA